MTTPAALEDLAKRMSALTALKDVRHLTFEVAWEVANRGASCRAAACLAEHARIRPPEAANIFNLNYRFTSARPQRRAVPCNLACGLGRNNIRNNSLAVRCVRVLATIIVP